RPVFRDEIQSSLCRRPQSPLPQHPSKLPSNPAIHSTFPHFLHLIHLTLTFSSDLSVIICGDRPVTEQGENPLTATTASLILSIGFLRQEMMWTPNRW
ncbi:hypothetical protein QQF64_033665, partial [Cirrhinus molitorella]